ncbi:transcriptional regulator, partial [Streptomyces sp. SID10244]|nr:transcriptional regulator [Streptomyces sp. SID10244]
ELLGTHVQRLATIANGDCVCTTHVPLHPPPEGATVPSDTTQTTASDAQPASAHPMKTSRKASR